MVKLEKWLQDSNMQKSIFGILITTACFCVFGIVTIIIWSENGGVGGFFTAIFAVLTCLSGIGFVGSVISIFPNWYEMDKRRK
jgi:hypothetical protein